MTGRFPLSALRGGGARPTVALGEGLISVAALSLWNVGVRPTYAWRSTCGWRLLRPGDLTMGRYLGIPLLALAAILNTTVMAQFRLGGGAPDLVFLLVMSWALLADVREAMLWAVIGGLMQDSLSIAPWGASSIGLVVVAFAADAAFGDVSRRNVLIPPLVAAAGTVVYHLGILAALRFSGTSVPVSTGLSYVTFPTVIYNVILSIPVFRLIGVLHQILQPRRVRLE